VLREHHDAQLGIAPRYETVSGQSHTLVSAARIGA
jgi:hypothetical protein